MGKGAAAAAQGVVPGRPWLAQRCGVGEGAAVDVAIAEAGRAVGQRGGCGDRGTGRSGTAGRRRPRAEAPRDGKAIAAITARVRIGSLYLHPFGPCPKCNGGVYEMGLAYVCEHQVAKPKTCDFRSGRIILQQEILPDQMAKLLSEGKTDLLPGFVSQRTRRPFKAFLVRGKDGKISFEFEERKAKPAAKGKAAAAANDAEGDGDVAVAKKTTAKAAKPDKADTTTKPAATSSTPSASPSSSKD